MGTTTLLHELHPPRQCGRAAPGGPAPLLRLCSADDAQRHHRQRPRAPGRAARRRRRPRDPGRRRARVEIADTRVSEELIKVSEALRELAERSTRSSAELVDMRYFGGYSEAEIAELQGITDRTVRRLGQGPGLALRRAQRQPARRRPRAEAEVSIQPWRAGRPACLHLHLRPGARLPARVETTWADGPGSARRRVLDRQQRQRFGRGAICMGRLLRRRPPVSRSEPCRAIPPTVAFAPREARPSTGASSSSCSGMTLTATPMLCPRPPRITHAQRHDIGEVGAPGQGDVALVGPGVVGRIELDPAVVGAKSARPRRARRRRRAAAPARRRIGAQVARDVARRQALTAQAGEHDGGRNPGRRRCAARSTSSTWV